MIGTLLNAAGILAGGAAGLGTKRQIPAAYQLKAKFFLGIFTVYAGLSAAWNGVSGSFKEVVGQILILLLALILGNVIGKWIGIQRMMNHLGRYARQSLDRSTSTPPSHFSEGFITCALLYCVGPMALLGALQEGLTGSIKILGVKTVLDGLATMAFARIYGWGVMLSAIPVLAYQGTITLLTHSIHPFLHHHGLIDSVAAMNGLLILCLSLVIFELKKVQLGDYLPSLLVAPLLTWLWHGTAHSSGV